MIPVAMQDLTRRQNITFNCIIDTGFNGDVQLPTIDINRLGLISTGTVNTQLADGQMVRSRTYQAMAIWMEVPTVVNVVESETNIPLIGAGLLWGSVMTIEWEFGGRVSVEPISQPE